MEKYNQTLTQAIELFGPESQQLMTIGEIGEFLQLYGRMTQGRATRQEWISEIADVTIMMRQMALLNGIEEVNAMIAHKVERLQQRIDALLT